MTRPPVTLDEFKAHLNLPSNTKESDTELQLHLNAATEALEKRVGAMVTREFTERVTARGGLLLLANAPVVELASVTEVGGTAWTIGDLYVAADSIVRLSAGGQLPGVDFTVTYTAGRGAIADVPARFKLATLIVAEHLWETQRGTAVRPAMFGMAPEPTSTGTAADAGYVYRGFALPRRALELLAGDQDIAFA